MRYNILRINKKIIYLGLILLAMFLCQNVFAEDNNAIEITVKNISSGEILYQKIFPKDEAFSDYQVINGFTVSIHYNPDYPGMIYNVHQGNNYFIFNVSGELNWGSYQQSGDIACIVDVIHYDFPPPSNITSNTTTTSTTSTKAPIPLNVYLIITAFFTYILYKKSKT
ncbi:conserved hypothetical protein [Methanocaldococcus vulcanius M7]|uniref:Uncharacterized protein n=1 Tax=Methanocaldococcus vulcanius (strain ATCC 700851 / DSM 12094 / M7) TaxID=579137 RepID=C9RE33_METVM|nr:hypothetical protein [Methanocaldococcus vulcanius]ACX73562.1 conserved hypothetical protein [Methanocaldococcus vulcanius M7]